MLVCYKRIAFSVAFLTGHCFAPVLSVGLQADTARNPIETTITKLIKFSAKFDGKRVRVPASFHTDGIERSVLLEPNCAAEHSPPRAPQCGRGVVPLDSDKSRNDPGNAELDRLLAQSGRTGTMDKHITAEFVGVFRCVPSCASPKYFGLDIESVENLRVEIRDTKPHRPTNQHNGT